MDVELILTVCFAAISTLGMICTFAYVKYNNSFADKQNTEVTLTGTMCDPKTGTVLAEKRLTMNIFNIENFKTEILEIKNGKKEIKQISSAKTVEHSPTPVTASKVNKRMEVSENSHLLDIENSELELAINANDDERYEEVIRISDFQSMLNNNALGDKEISQTRQYILLNVLNAWHKSIEQDYNFWGAYYGVSASEASTDVSGDISV